jgi:hypothetical protein
MDMTALVRVDERGRVALGKVADAGDYRATRRGDGSVILEPVHVVTEAELAVLRNPVVIGALDAAFEGDASKSVEYDWR